MSVTTAPGFEQANSGLATVTRPPMSAAERMSRMRARRRVADAATATAPLMYDRPDWRLFADPSTLPQKAGCQPRELGRVVLKELVDNALDTGANVTLDRVDHGGIIGYVITDDGFGIDPAAVPRLFAVNRSLLSSKLKRRPLRGMLGNGLRVVMGAVAALDGHISVTSHGRCLTLAIDPATGGTKVLRDDSVGMAPGAAITIALRAFNQTEATPAKLSIAIGNAGRSYIGPSRPEWYGPKGLHALFAHVVPETAVVTDVLRDVFGLDQYDRRAARDLAPSDIAALHVELCRSAGPSIDIGYIGPNEILGRHHARVTGTASIEGAAVPYCIECWASCVRVEARGDGEACLDLLINRSPSLAQLSAYPSANGITVRGCGLYRTVPGPKTARYDITLSLITPYLRLANDGKTPALGDFDRSIAEAMKKAAGAAYRAMARPPRQISIKDAAWAVMKAAYLKASDGGKLPANARQIMYAARPDILSVTGIDKLGDAYFTQNVLPDFIEVHPELCGDWDVVFDARGHFIEPHTDRVVPLGTIEVRSYLGDRPRLGPAVMLNADALYPTSGPQNRFRNILFVEKEGFDPLLQQARIAERYDLAVMSTKGMSVVAARMLLDRLAPLIDRVFVLHDFDIAGFSIFGTLGANGRRYVYKNAVNMVDLGLRLGDVQAMGLEAEPVIIKDFESRVDTLRAHGATDEEIEFLKDERVELNAMTSREMVDFIEAKLTMHRVAKVVPDVGIIEAHARRLIEQRLAGEALAEIRDQITRQAAATPLPKGIEVQLRRYLARHPSLAWDDALAQIVGGQNGLDVVG